MKAMTKRLTAGVGWAVLVVAPLALMCRGTSQNGRKPHDSYVAEIQDWHRKRIESLKSPNGWLNLVGLFWLKEGENRFGSDPSNDIVFPEGKAPRFIGTITLRDGVVRTRIDRGVEVLHDGKPVREIPMKTDAQGNPTVLSLGSLRWFIIERKKGYGVRLRDLESPRVAEFMGIEMFPIDSAWRVEARFEPYVPPKMISVPTILGTTRRQPSPGALVFKIRGKTYRLDPIAEPEDKELFVIFSDETAGIETYGGGRFLYVNRPGKDGKTVIDFNKAYNPPCAFTPYATCPLPPAQNHLPFRVTAGEKKYGHGSH